jgi:hypothetical protein
MEAKPVWRNQNAVWACHAVAGLLTRGFQSKTVRSKPQADSKEIIRNMPAMMKKSNPMYL